MPVIDLLAPKSEMG